MHCFDAKSKKFFQRKINFPNEFVDEKLEQFFLTIATRLKSDFT